ncbi:nicotinate phosphoribosyltransferase [Marivirga sp. S37H4]|uniref:Nicotinamide phosphoribosyltransferase n=1 Tax=Marivirga aurantiaca TaxID=2802615 RepID=A0A934WYY8_9BACT|nr:nicotinate phosphoribosyltransferase [Marivirga aurantiaca]MBK6265773.1 nicotinate phosphoribosyltransferase [Marivirga aurantiaca]
MRNNLVLLADGYKYSHHKLYYPGTEKVCSYLESRGGKFDNTVFYGLQYFLKTFLEGQAFTQADLDEAEPILESVFGRNDVFDKSKFQYILDKHKGKLPVRIKAVPEGKAVPVQNVLMTIENTDPKCYWLPNFLETLLMQIWYPCTVATLSREIKKVITQYYDETATPGSEAGIPFVLNDFGARGVSSLESAGIGGSAHLINFNGSDTISASVFAQKYYAAKEVYGKSIPATEHSICTLLGEKGEKGIFKHVLDEFPAGLVACVSDSYDIFRACKEYWGEEFKERILERDGVLVIRPDSGDPVMTLLKVYEILFEKFGYTINEKGYKVLPPQVRVIQGDGVNYEAIQEIFEALKTNKISAENLVLGMGGALLQKLDRDTQKFALKCSYAEINGKAVLVQKRPKELDKSGKIIESFKKSKAGKLKLVKINGVYSTVAAHELPEVPDELVTVFENGKVLKEWTFEEIRKNAAIEENQAVFI